MHPINNINNINKPEPLLNIQNLCIEYQDKKIIQNLNLTMHAGQIYTLLGHSGSGKSSILRAIAGLIPIQAGEIFLQQNLISSHTYQKNIHQRQIGMMFQDFALFPHLNVIENIRLGLLKLNKAAQQQRIDEMLELVGLKAHHQNMPHQLSGGQQQRLALARSLAPKPLCLLLDEPFSSLDHSLREQLSLEVRDILKHEATTALIVTHDQNEAFAMSDQIAILANGCIQQIDTPENLYHLPQSPEIAKLIGHACFIEGIVVEEERGEKEEQKEDVNFSKRVFLTPLGYLRAHKKQILQGCERCLGERVQILIRPDDIILEPINHSENINNINYTNHSNFLKVKVISKSYHGADFLYQVQMLEQNVDWLNHPQTYDSTQNLTQNLTQQTIELLAQAPSRQAFEIGQILKMHVDLYYLSAFTI